MAVERWAGEWADEILGRPEQPPERRRWFVPPEVDMDLMVIDASQWTPEQIREWRRLNPSKDPDRWLNLGNPHGPSADARWKAAFEDE